MMEILILYIQKKGGEIFDFEKILVINLPARSIHAIYKLFTKS